LQEPLRKITSFGERLNLSSTTALDAPSRAHLERMLGAAARMRTLVNDLLVYSQVATRAEGFVDTDLGKIAKEVIADLETAIADEGARIEVGTLPIVEADPLQMRQLLQNLLGNALKYRRKDAPSVVRVSSTGTSGRVCTIVVADNGIGFNDQYADKIFKMFERLHGKNEYAGSGIGLAICRAIVLRHKGTIVATGRPGEGATFTVTLPVVQVTSGTFS